MAVDHKTIKTLEQVAADISQMAMELTQEQQNISPDAFDLAMLSSRLLGNARELGDLLGKLRQNGAD